MEDSIQDNVPPAALRDPSHKRWSDTKASDDFLDRVFESYLESLNLPISHFRKSDYHQLARFVPPSLIDSEVTEVLDGIWSVSQAAAAIS